MGWRYRQPILDAHGARRYVRQPTAVRSRAADDRPASVHRRAVLAVVGNGVSARRRRSSTQTFEPATPPRATLLDLYGTETTLASSQAHERRTSQSWCLFVRDRSAHCARRLHIIVAVDCKQAFLNHFGVESRPGGQHGRTASGSRERCGVHLRRGCRAPRTLAATFGTDAVCADQRFNHSRVHRDSRP